jgi:glycogen debranching enzyme
VLEGVLVEQRLAVARAQHRELAARQRHDLLDEIHVRSVGADAGPPDAPPCKFMSAAADLTHTTVLKDGNAFLVTTPSGDVPLAGGHPLGLYRDDCRFLSGHELQVGGARPRLLVASETTGAAAVHELTNPHLDLPTGRTLAPQTLQVRVERTLAGETALRERIRVRHHGRAPVALDVDVALAADFRPMLALRGAVRLPPAEVAVEPVDGGLRFTARGRDGVLRTTTVTAEPAPAAVDADQARLRFTLALDPGGAGDVGITYELRQGDEPPSSAEPDDRHERDAEPPLVGADDELFGRILDRALLDLRMLRSRLDGQAYYAAGVPWYATLFGRDSLITATQTLAFDPRIAEQTLRLLARRLGRVVDPVREEEPGKVLHELRLGEIGALELTPLARYYGTVDATPLFLCLLADHADWSGDLALFRELRSGVDAALRWIDCHGDHDGDGLLDYAAADPEGLRNQGWKDSNDGVVDARGEPLEPPIALVEVQGYAVRAKRRLAALFARDGDPERAHALEDEADELQAMLERFWLEDRRCYAMAIDRDGQPSGALASNQGHLLWAGAVPAGARAHAVRDALMGDALNSGWGIRTLGRGEAGFNPVGYHLGSVWPHDTAMIAVGLRRYGYDAEFTALFEALLEAASHADGYRLPELFAGFPRTEFEVPVPYPVACRPQAWAAGAIPSLLAEALGLRADGLAGRLVIARPTLPRWLAHVEVTGLRVAGARCDLAFERTRDSGHVALTDARVDGDVEVVLEM